MVLTVREVLQLSCMRGARLVTGAGGLEKVVRWVNIQEVLDCFDLLTPGELLITTGYGLAGNLQLQQSLIEVLVQKQLSGLAIQTGFYLDRIPPSLLSTADSLAFPVIELPRDAAFRTLTEEVLRQIVERQNQLLEYSENIQGLLTAAALETPDLGKLAQILAGIIERPVRILNASFRPLAIEVPGQHSHDLQALDQVTEECNLLQARNICPGPPALHPVQIKNLSGISDQVVIPIWGGKKLLGYVSALGGADERCTAALQRASVVLSFILLKDEAVRDSERRMREDFLADLLTGSYISEEATRAKAALLGYRLDLPQLVAKFTWQDTHAELPQRLAALTADYFAHLPMSALFRAESKQILVLMGGDPAASKTSLIELHSRLKTCERAIFCGVSTAAYECPQLLNSFNQASEAAELALALNRYEFPALFEDLGVYRLLFPLRYESGLRDFYAATVKNLVEYDQSHHSSLILSLETYYDCGRNRRETAKKLFLHRHTLTYRLERIQRICGLDPDDPQQALRLHLGILAARVLRKLEPGNE